MPPYFYETGFFVSQQGERKQKLREIGSKVYTIFFEEPTKYGFEIREGQQEMACEIVYAITGGSHLAVEAGVGIGKSYSYFIGSTGFPVEDGASLSEPKPSPFPYNEYATIYYCDDLPHPTREHEEFIKQETARLIDILNISKGKTLVLFTAKTDMEEVYAALQSQKLPYKILMQQAGSSQENVLQEFEENTDSVLLGTGAY